MTTYTVSYFIKNPTKFEEGATVTEMGNGWFRVVKVFEGWSQVDEHEFEKHFVFPIGSAGHTIETGFYAPACVPCKPKRKAAWKQNPLQRFAPRSKA
jgi:hypothetical protein